VLPTAATWPAADADDLAEAQRAIWGAAEAGDLPEVQRLVAQDPGLLNATRSRDDVTPLTLASRWGHVEVVRWLVDRGAAIGIALCFASSRGRTPWCGWLLLERGGDPTVTDKGGSTPLIHAFEGGHMETARCLLDHPSATAIINHRGRWGRTGLSWASANGHAGVVRALLEKGADHTIADSDGDTPMAMAKLHNRHACVELLKVRCSLSSSPPPFRLLTGLTGWCSVHGDRRRSGPTSCGRPGRWLTSRGAARWRSRGGRGGRRGRRGRRCWTSRCAI
jgi:hypothetical protein